MRHNTARRRSVHDWQREEARLYPGPGPGTGSTPCAPRPADGGGAGDGGRGGLDGRLAPARLEPAGGPDPGPGAGAGQRRPPLPGERAPAGDAPGAGLVNAGWRLFQHAQTGWGMRLVWGLAGYDGMCRPLGYQAFVFLNEQYTGTLSPQQMNSRTDGALQSVTLSAPIPGAAGRIAGTFSRYKAEDPLCCPSQTTVVQYRIQLGPQGPTVIAGQATGSQTAPPAPTSGAGPRHRGRTPSAPASPGSASPTTCAWPPTSSGRPSRPPPSRPSPSRPSAGPHRSTSASRSSRARTAPPRSAAPSAKPSSASTPWPGCGPSIPPWPRG